MEEIKKESIDIKQCSSCKHNMVKSPHLGKYFMLENKEPWFCENCGVLRS